MKIIGSREILQQKLGADGAVLRDSPHRPCSYPALPLPVAYRICFVQRDIERAIQQSFNLSS